jgi:hypothetical protein
MAEIEACAEREMKKRARRRKIKKGFTVAAVALAVLGGLEVVLQMLAAGPVSMEIRLVCAAAAAGIGFIIAKLGGRGGAALLLLVAGVSEAADRTRQYNTNVAGSACPTGTPGVLGDGKIPGLGTSGLYAYNITICPPAGQTFTGTGQLLACVFRYSPGPNKWALSNDFEKEITRSSSGTDGCLTFYDIQLGVWDGDLVHIISDPANPVALSSGTAMSVYLEGQLR